MNAATAEHDRRLKEATEAATDHEAKLPPALIQGIEQDFDRAVKRVIEPVNRRCRGDFNTDWMANIQKDLHAIVDIKSKSEATDEADIVPINV